MELKSSFNKGEPVITNRKYKKRFNAEIEGKVVGNTHFGRFVQIESEDGTIHSIKPEFIDYLEMKQVS